MLNLLKDVIGSVFVHFMPPLPRKSYTYESDDVASKYTLRLNQGSEWQHCHRYPEKFEAFFTETKSNNRIACLYIKSCDNPKYTILFSHGGTVDLGNLCNFFYTLGMRLNCNIFSYDYSGFGESTGKPTEKNVYADAEAAWDVLINKYGVTADKVVLYGQSLGTAASIYLGNKHPVRGIILHSPFLSIARIFMPNIHGENASTRFYDSFSNVDNIGKIDTKILIIHGTRDLVVPLSHAHKLNALCKNPAPPLWVEGGGHDNLYTYEEYLLRLKKFVDFDVNNNNSK
ncbi:alpha/beta hydrolase domain-containing protein 17B-like [Oppia nitens]|uniref:alpha/beta hydrolase domain-containing protein 17B-like n=1 Tax=Oppia nitens TaxID=1686743 RepID=UPI0023D9C270|nr:alpha/beta hydrolase domain-containing protein 17B-like [Oppia nitens]